MSMGSYYEFQPGQVYSGLGCCGAAPMMGFGEEVTVKDVLSPPVPNTTPVVAPPSTTVSVTIPNVDTKTMDPVVKWGLIAIGAGVIYKIFWK